MPPRLWEAAGQDVELYNLLCVLKARRPWAEGLLNPSFLLLRKHPFMLWDEAITQTYEELVTATSEGQARRSVGLLDHLMNRQRAPAVTRMSAVWILLTAPLAGVPSSASPSPCWAGIKLLKQVLSGGLSVAADHGQRCTAHSEIL